MGDRFRLILALVTGVVSTTLVFWKLGGPGNPLFTVIPLELRTYDMLQGPVVVLASLYSIALGVGAYLGTFFVKGQPIRAGVWIGLCNGAVFFVWYNLALMPNPLTLGSALWWLELVFAVTLFLTGVILGASGGLLAWGTVLIVQEVIDMVR